MRRMRAAPAVIAAGLLALLAAASLAGSLAGCGGGVLSPDVVVVNGGEPSNPLIPTTANDSFGGRIIDRLFAGLMSFDPDGKTSTEVAQSIETTDDVNYRITLKPGWKFTDGSPVTAHSFVDAWNYGALSTNAQLQQSFFSPIQGYDDVAASKPVITTMSGLQVVDDLQFTVRLKAPTIDFTVRLAFSPFYPLPTAAFRDMAAFGRNPIGDGPYKLADGPDGPAWEHNVKIDLRPNPDYHGNRMPHNKGLRFEFYANLDTAYSDLLSGNLDVLDTIPPSALPIYKRDLGGNATSGAGRVNQSLDTPLAAAAFRRRGGPAAPPGAVGCHQSPADLPADIRRNPHSGARFHRPVTAGFRSEHSGQRRVGLRSRPGAAALVASQRHLAVERPVRDRLQRRRGPSGVGGCGGQQHQERLGYRRGRRAAAHLRRIPHPDHQPHHRRPLSAPGGRVTTRRCWISLARCSSPGRVPTTSATPTRNSTRRWRRPNPRPRLQAVVCAG